MSISSTIGGVVKEITAPSATVGGVVHEFDAIHTVSGGVLKKIFSRANWEFPTSLTWSVDKSIANYDTNSKVNSTSNNGLTVKYTAKSEKNCTREGINEPCICSNSFFMPKGGKIVYTPTSASGQGTTTCFRAAYLVDESGEIVAGGTYPTSAPISSITLTAPSSGEYHIRLAGWSVTQLYTGTQITGFEYYTATITCDIAFSQP